MDGVYCKGGYGESYQTCKAYNKGYCEHHEFDKPLTYYDQVKNMKVEELATFLSERVQKATNYFRVQDGLKPIYLNATEKRMLNLQWAKWLLSEVQEDEM